MKKIFLTWVAFAAMVVGFGSCSNSGGGSNPPEDKAAQELAEINAGKLFNVEKATIIIQNQWNKREDTLRFVDYGRKVCLKHSNTSTYRYVSIYDNSAKNYKEYTVNDRDKDYAVNTQKPAFILENNWGDRPEKYKADTATTLADTVICGKNCIGFQIKPDSLKNVHNRHIYARVRMKETDPLDYNVNELVILFDETTAIDSTIFNFNGYKEVN